MKMKNFFVVLLTVAISLFVVACGGDSIKENSEEIQPVNQDIKPDTKENTQQDTEQDGSKDEFYLIIKEAWQRQVDYINSIDEPIVKQSVQTSESAAIMESNRLLIEYPGEYEAIDASLKRVLSGE